MAMVTAVIVVRCGKAVVFVRLALTVVCGVCEIYIYIYRF